LRRALVRLRILHDAAFPSAHPLSSSSRRSASRSATFATSTPPWR
jgi:hypothetical protein